MSRSERRTREIAHTKQDILTAAATAFAKNGYHGTKMEDIAEEAGYAIASLYKYFKGKDEIYINTLDAITLQFQSTFEQPGLSAMSFAKCLEYLLIKQFTIVENNKSFFHMFFTQHHHQIWHAGSELGDLCCKRHDQMINHIKKFIEKGIDSGEILFPDAYQAANYVHGIVHAAIFQSLFDQSQISMVDKIPSLLTFILNGLGLVHTAHSSDTAYKFKPIEKELHA